MELTIFIDIKFEIEKFDFSFFRNVGKVYSLGTQCILYGQNKKNRDTHNDNRNTVSGADSDYRNVRTCEP